MALTRFRVAYAGLAGFLLLEATARQGGSTASLRASDDDAGTTRAIVRAFAAGATLPFLLRRLPGSRLLRGAAVPGLATEGAGLAGRIWSMRTLGAAYTRTLRTGEAQPLVSDGPYRLVRHPGYLGTLLTWTGFGLATGNPWVVVMLGVLFPRAYGRRIVAEERLLVRELPGYAAYARRTRRLIPFVW